MVIHSIVAILILLVHFLTGCSDAVSIDTPRQVDTLDEERTLLRAVDVTSQTEARVTVNGVEADCFLLPTSKCTLFEYSDGTIALDVIVSLSNRSMIPVLPVDILAYTFRSGLLPQDSSILINSAPIEQSENGLSITFFHNTNEVVDQTEFTRIPVRVTRNNIDEQKTLDDLVIKRTYSGFEVTDDTTRIPFDVFSIRNTDLYVDTSYSITTRHLGTRSSTSETPVQPPLFGGEPIAPSMRVVRTGTTASMTVDLAASGNQQLQVLLGTQGTARLELTVDLR